MPNPSQETDFKAPRAFAPLEREVELSRELVANLERATILLNDLNPQELERWRQTEGKRLDEQVISPVEKFVKNEIKQAEEALALPGKEIGVIAPQEMINRARYLQSLAGKMLYFARAALDKAEGRKQVSRKGVKVTMTPAKASKPGGAPFKHDEATMKKAVEIMLSGSDTVSRIAEQFKVSVPTLYVWRKKLAKAKKQATTKIKPRAVASATK